MEAVLVIFVGDKDSITYKCLNILNIDIGTGILNEDATEQTVSRSYIGGYLCEIVFAKCVTSINLEISKSNLNYFCIIQDNTFLHDGWLQDLVVAYNEMPIKCGVASILSDFSNKEFTSLYSEETDSFNFDIIESDSISGVMLFDRNVIDCIGYFDLSIEAYLKHFSIRAGLFGLKNFYLSNKSCVFFDVKKDETSLLKSINEMKNTNLYIYFSTN
jgi:hypothetical protein